MAILPLTTSSLSAWLEKQPAAIKAWVKASGFSAQAGSFLLLAAKDGNLKHVLFGVAEKTGLYAYADLPFKLPHNPHGYYIDKKMNTEEASAAATGWGLGCYAFDTYKSGAKRTFSPLIWPEKADREHVKSTVEAIALVRDLVNTPANDMGPEELSKAAQKQAHHHKATFKTILGEDLLRKNYPAIYAVGKGSPREPRLIDMHWGKKTHPLITLVGKGVCFDTGGLDLKPSGAMDLMKKDMGGAAHALGLAHLIISAKLPVRLRVLIPAVENSTDGNSYRPRDILQTRKGITVEVGDTDAEGRLVLADALAEACADKPSLIIDFATLTGAARVALGPDIPALFSNDDKLAHQLQSLSLHHEDPLWQLPLWQPYKDMMASRVADTNNVGGSFAGSITAALFLEKFVDRSIPWVHIDTYAWNASSRPGRPDGGEALGIRACFELIKKNFGS